MRFFSDNAAAVCPEVMAALAAANSLDTAYDGDRWSQRLDTVFSDLFETQVSALWVATGTAANALALAALCPPWGSVVCHRDAHIQNDECGAPEFYTHGAKLLLGEGTGAKLTPGTVRGLLDTIRNDVHQAQPAAISITNATEYGLVYTPDEVAALGALARERGLALHMDGARFANAVVRLGCPVADITWKAGVDALSFGFAKNGGMSAEVLIFFGERHRQETLYRRKRAGHLLSKGRFMAAQVLAMLENDVWLRNARAANDAAARLAAAAGERLVLPVEANEVFLRVSPAEAKSLRDQGFDFYDWGVGEARLVTSWDSDRQAVDRLAEAIAAL
ncbi:low specificity L-threonine aldolase [Sphingosinicella sp. BN140058]|uniref:threonine aldolase family protein n=1 Tax=Sphingosinicella sp. BN140058 TaxID=1892855 RepID=UPI00101251AA|nr:beta-eliminating lyase-related protein [Sphingosinicella sp. BN140058]QAY77191.1 low specificity L-threonine aldolase [Sphingosinicella sp. BN140058]